MGPSLPVTTGTLTLTQVPSLYVTSVQQARMFHPTVPIAVCESARNAQQAPSHGVRTVFNSATTAELAAKHLLLKSLLAQLLWTACVCARLVLTSRPESASTTQCAYVVGV